MSLRLRSLALLLLCLCTLPLAAQPQPLDNYGPRPPAPVGEPLLRELAQALDKLAAALPALANPKVDLGPNAFLAVVLVCGAGVLGIVVWRRPLP